MQGGVPMRILSPSRLFICFTLALTLTSTPVSAASFEYAVTGIFEDGGTLNGMFTWDTTVGVGAVTQFMIQTTNFNPFGHQTLNIYDSNDPFDSANIDLGFNLFFQFDDNDIFSGPAFAFFGLNADPPTTLDFLKVGAEFSGTMAETIIGLTPQELYENLGTFTATRKSSDPIPEPSTMLLFGSGIFGIVVLRWIRGK